LVQCSPLTLERWAFHGQVEVIENAVWWAGTWPSLAGALELARPSQPPALELAGASEVASESAVQRAGAWLSAPLWASEGGASEEPPGASEEGAVDLALEARASQLRLLQSLVCRLAY
jgi:hypothetical protein